MTQAERFLKFVQQRQARAIKDVEVSIRIEEDDVIVTQCWIDRSAKASFPPPTAEAQQPH